MKWIKTEMGSYINVEEIEGIGLSDMDSYDYRVTMKSGDIWYIQEMDFQKVKKLLKFMEHAVDGDGRKKGKGQEISL